MTITAHRRVRCAIYTRKSSEEGLERSFNSLQAQREACEAYIASQRHEGWQVIPHKYDDGGFTGGNMNRPALKQLLDDIAARRVDTVVVYKVDRLTRSLMDFAKIIEAFDQKGVSFVSITQQFNTTTSMGRLTLNVLLSFAQFEREVTGERIRDKIAASKKKGMWMGGVVPLGYDLKGRKLVINEKEAKIVREIFEQYLAFGSVAELKKHLDTKHIRTKVRTSANRREFGGQRYSRGGLYKLLKNQVYIGKIAHRGETYAGQHLPIISAETWDKVSVLLKTNNQGQRRPGRSLATSPLAGLVFDEEGNRYTPTHAVKGGRRYRYYTSQAVIHKRKKPSYLDRIPAKELEQLVSSRIQKFLASPDEFAAACAESGWPENDLRRVIDASEGLAATWSKLTSTETADILQRSIRRTVIQRSGIQIDVDVSPLITCALGEPVEAQHSEACSPAAHPFTLTAPFSLARHRGELRLVVPGAVNGSVKVNSKANSTLLKAIVRARRWKERILNGEIYCKEQLASEENLNASYVGRILQLATLSPECLESIICTTEETSSLAKFVDGLPLDWNEQKSKFCHRFAPSC
jgi:DNA invertase Pin-like site-specific DNA recombinase